MENSRKTCRKLGFCRNYLKLCRHKNIKPLSEIKKGNPFVLELFIDRIDIDNWLAIIESLSDDTSLITISLKLRKRSDHGKFMQNFYRSQNSCHQFNSVLEDINSLNRLRKYDCQLVVLSKYIFDELIKALAQVLKSSKNLTRLCLEGLPLLSKYTHFLLEVGNFGY